MKNTVVGNTGTTTPTEPRPTATQPTPNQAQRAGPRDTALSASGVLVLAGITWHLLVDATRARRAIADRVPVPTTMA
jgi:hypothetical protein